MGMGRGPRVLLLLLVAALALPAAASATTLPPSSFTASCPAENPAGEPYGGVRICSGTVPSFDQAKMDVDLTQPAAGTGAGHPLIVMLHGFGNDKREWESTTDEGDGADKPHWNNHWFAEHGYYVLSYTARGFSDDGADEETTQPPTPGDPSGSEDPAHRGFIQLKSRDYEIRDTQWLTALVAATYPDVDPDRIAVTGGSYGGIESWLQASQATWTFPSARDASLPVLNLQVAVAKYPSTDLAYSLAPNGQAAGRACRTSTSRRRGAPPATSARATRSARRRRATSMGCSRSARRMACSSPAPRTTRRSRAPTTTARGRIRFPPSARAPPPAIPRPTATR
jgi:dienelactone hydrolase